MYLNYGKILYSQVFGVIIYNKCYYTQDYLFFEKIACTQINKNLELKRGNDENGKTNHPDQPNINTKIELVDQWLADLVREVRENRRLLDEHIKKAIEKDKLI